MKSVTIKKKGKSVKTMTRNPKWGILPEGRFCLGSKRNPLTLTNLLWILG